MLLYQLHFDSVIVSASPLLGQCYCFSFTWTLLLYQLPLHLDSFIVSASLGQCYCISFTWRGSREVDAPLKAETSARPPPCPALRALQTFLCSLAHRQMLFCRVTLGKSFLQFSAMKMAHAPPGHHSVIGRPSVNGLAYAEYVIYRGEQVRNNSTLTLCVMWSTTFAEDNTLVRTAPFNS